MDEEKVPAAALVHEKRRKSVRSGSKWRPENPKAKMENVHNAHPYRTNANVGLIFPDHYC